MSPADTELARMTQGLAEAYAAARQLRQLTRVEPRSAVHALGELRFASWERQIEALLEDATAAGPLIEVLRG